MIKGIITETGLFADDLVTPIISTSTQEILAALTTSGDGVVQSSADPLTGVSIDTNGMSGYNASNVQTAEVNTDGSGFFGLGSAPPITWTAAGVVTVAGWTASDTKFSNGLVELDAGNQLLKLGTVTDFLMDGTDAGVLMGLGATYYEFFAGKEDGNYIHWNGLTLNIAGTISADAGNIGGFHIGAADMWAGNPSLAHADTKMVMGDAVDAGTPKIALGPSADAITIAGTEVGFMATGDGHMKTYIDASNFMRVDASGVNITADTFNLNTSTMVITSDPKISMGATPPTSPTVGTGIFMNAAGIYGLDTNTQNFVLDATDGSITSISGNIGGWNIGSTSLSTGTEGTDGVHLVYSGTAGSAHISMGAASAVNTGDGIWAAGNGDFRAGAAAGNRLQFSGGDLTVVATNASITGTSGWLGASGVLAWTGSAVTMGGWSVDTDSIDSGVLGTSGIHLVHDSTPTNTYIAMGEATALGTGAGMFVDGNGYLRAGDPAGDFFQFDSNGIQWTTTNTSLSTAGLLTTVSAHIGGDTNYWDVGAGTITAVGTGLIRTSSGNARVEVNSAGIKAYDATPLQRVEIANDGAGWFGASDKFSWTNAGVVTISGWTVNSAYLAKDTGTDNTSAGMAPTDWPFYAGAIYTNRATAPFRVNPAGELFASGATISGEITATTGAIGGWVIDDANIYSLTSGTPDSTPNQGIAISTDIGADSLPVINVYDSTPAIVAAVGNYAAGKQGLYGIEGSVGGWELTSDLLRSADASSARVELNKALNRVAVFDATNEKVVMGYLDGLPKNPIKGDATAGSTTTVTDSTAAWTVNAYDGAFVEIISGTGTGQGLKEIASNTGTTLTLTGTWVTAPDDTSEYRITGIGDYTAADYGFWARPGDNLYIDGDVQYENGDWLISHDASYLVQDSAANTILRMGTDSGDKGFFVYNTAGDQLAKMISTEIFVGEATKYMQYTTGGGLVVKGDITADAGYIGGDTGWTIASNVLHSNIAAGQVTGLQMPSDANTKTFFSGGDDSTGTNAPFYVNRGGDLVATSATIEGSITATLGAIGGWVIGDYGLTSTLIGMYSAGYTEGAEILLGHATLYADAKIGLKADGSGKVADGNFIWDTSGNVTMAGAFTSTATITGGTIQTASSGDRVELTSANGIRGYGGTASAQRYELSNAGSGWLGASSTIAWSTEGAVTIAGWGVDSDSIDGGTLGADGVHLVYSAGSSYIALGGASALGTGDGIWMAGNGDFRAGAAGGNRLEFSSSDLTIVATNASITGTTGWLGANNVFSWNAAAVTMGGWSVDTDSIDSGTLGTSGIHLVHNATPANTYMAMGLATDLGTGAGMFIDGSGYFRAGDPAGDYFQFTSSGIEWNTTATSLDINGKLTTTSAAIGTWNVSTDSIRSGANNTSGVVLMPDSGFDSAPLIKAYNETPTLVAAMGNYASGKHGLYGIAGEVGGFTLEDGYITGGGSGVFRTNNPTGVSVYLTGNMTGDDGTVAGSTYTPDVSPGWTVDELIGYKINQYTAGGGLWATATITDNTATSLTHNGVLTEGYRWEIAGNPAAVLSGIDNTFKMYDEWGIERFSISNEFNTYRGYTIPRIEMNMGSILLTDGTTSLDSLIFDQEGISSTVAANLPGRPAWLDLYTYWTYKGDGSAGDDVQRHLLNLDMEGGGGWNVDSTTNTGHVMYGIKSYVQVSNDTNKNVPLYGIHSTVVSGSGKDWWDLYAFYGNGGISHFNDGLELGSVTLPSSPRNGMIMYDGDFKGRKAGAWFSFTDSGSGMSGFDIAADTGTTQTVTDSETVTFASGGSISSSVSSTGGTTVTYSLASGLAVIGAMTVLEDYFLVGGPLGVWDLKSPANARGSIGLDTDDNPQFNHLGLATAATVLDQLVIDATNVTSTANASLTGINISGTLENNAAIPGTMYGILNDVDFEYSGVGTAGARGAVFNAPALAETSSGHFGSVYTVFISGAPTGGAPTGYVRALHVNAGESYINELLLGTDLAVADGGTGKSSWTLGGVVYADTTTSLSQVTPGGGTHEVFVASDVGVMSWSTSIDASITHTEWDAAYAHISADGSSHSDVVLNTTHRGSTGTDHGYINQSVTSTSTPIFSSLTLGSTEDLDYNLKLNYTRTVSVNQNAAGIYVNPTFTEGSLGTHSLIAGIHIAAFNIMNGTASTGDAAAIYIEGGPGGTASPSKTWAIYDAGSTPSSLYSLALNQDLSVSYGGTGQSSWTQYGLLYAPATTTLGQIGLGTTTQVLHGNAAGAPSWGALDLSNSVTGTLGTTNGGTGLAAYAQYDLLYASAVNTLAALTTATHGILKTNDSGLPAWYVPGSNKILGTDIDGYITSYGGAVNQVFITDSSDPDPTWSSTLPSAVQGNITSVGAITSGSWTSSTAVGATYGGTGMTSHAINTMLYASSANTLTSLAAPGNNYVLTTNGSGVPTWVAQGSGFNPSADTYVEVAGDTMTGELEIKKAVDSSIFTGLTVWNSSDTGTRTAGINFSTGSTEDINGFIRFRSTDTFYMNMGSQQLMGATTHAITFFEDPGGGSTKRTITNIGSGTGLIESTWEVGGSSDLIVWDETTASGSGYEWRIDGNTLMDVDSSGNLTAVGTGSFTNGVFVDVTVAGDGGWNEGIVIDNTAADGEAAIAFRQSEMLTNYWIMGVNQSTPFKLAYGTSFTDGNSVLELSSAGALSVDSTITGTDIRLRSAGSYALIIDTSETYNTANRSLTILTGDANRQLTLDGNTTISGTHSGTSSGTNTGDQDVAYATTIDLGGLDNVTEASPANGDLLVYVTDHWENQTLAEAGVQPAGTYDNYVDWNITSDSGGPANITSNFTIDFEGGDGIGTSWDTDTLTIAVDSSVARSTATDTISGQWTFSTGPYMTAAQGFILEETVTGLTYSPQEGVGTYQTRYFMLFDYTQDASFPYLTNRTPSGKVEIHSGTTAAGGELPRMSFAGGDGNQNISLTNVSKFGWGSTYMASAGFTGSLTGNADTATTAGKWTSPITIQLSGEVTSDAVNIDGSGNVTITNTNVTGTYDNYQYWQFAADSGLPATNLASTERLLFAGGTGISSVSSGTGSPYTITFNHDSHTGDVTGSTTLTIGALKVATGMIQNDSVTYSKMQNAVNNNVLLGNISGTGGIISELGASAVRTLLNVADGADAYSSWGIDADSGGVQGVYSGNSVDFAGGTNVTTALTGGPSVWTLTISATDVVRTDIGTIGKSWNGNYLTWNYSAGTNNDYIGYNDSTLDGSPGSFYFNADVAYSATVSGNANVLAGQYYVGSTLVLTSGGAIQNVTNTNWDTAYTHSGVTTGNPHSVSASDVGLGNVTNESKATMFTSPTFTTSVTIPTTADDGTYTGIVTNDSGVLKYRTKAQILSDIGAQAAGTYDDYNYWQAQGDSGVQNISTTEALDFSGGTGITTTLTGPSPNTLDISIDSTVATLVGIQTLTNKTLTYPTVNSPLMYDIDIYDTSALQKLTIVVTDLAAARNATVPALSAHDTFVFANQSQTLANKTLNEPGITDFTSAVHDHSDDTGGGTIDYGDLLNTPTNSTWDHNSLTNTHNLTTDIDHNALTNYVANEHINWTAASNNFVTTGTATADILMLTGDSTDTFRHRVTVYGTGTGTDYGMMLWNTSTTTGDWSTMIFGPNQANRRISFGKVNQATPTLHAHLTEMAYIDLDDGQMYLDTKQVATRSWVTDQSYSTTTGTVTSVSGTGTVSGITLTGTVTTSGSLTLGGTVSISSSNITDVQAFSQSGTYASLRAQATTAGDVGLGNVTNESKATMFASPTFTTSVTIPTTADDATYTGIVTNDSGVLKYRTKTQILSDIGAQAAGTYDNYVKWQVAADSPGTAVDINASERLLISGDAGAITTASSGASSPYTIDISHTSGAGYEHLPAAAAGNYVTYTTGANTWTAGALTGGTGIKAIFSSGIDLSVDLSEVPTDATIATTDYIPFVDVSESNATNKALVSSLLALGTQGTVTSVSGTGSVSGITLTGTVTSTGNLTLGGTFATTSASISDVDAFSQSGTYASLRAQATTAGDVGLGNVTDESKATMFASPTFTGTVSMPAMTMSGDINMSYGAIDYAYYIYIRPDDDAQTGYGFKNAAGTYKGGIDYSYDDVTADSMVFRNIGTGGYFFKSSTPATIMSLTNAGVLNIASDLQTGGTTRISGAGALQNVTVTGDVTAASTKITLAGSPTNSTIGSFSIDVNEANLTHDNIGGTLGVTKGGTGLSAIAYTGILWASSANTLAVYTPGSYGVLRSNADGELQSVAGAVDQVMITEDSDPVPYFSSTLPSAVQGNITSLGTISSGTWNGTKVGVTYGGTNLSSIAINSMLYASAANVYSALAPANSSFLTSTAGGVPNWITVAAARSALGKDLTVGTGLDIGSGGIGAVLQATSINLDLTEVIATDGANRMLTSDGDGTLTAEANVTYDGTQLAVVGSNSVNPSNPGHFGVVSQNSYAGGYATVGAYSTSTSTNGIPTFALYMQAGASDSQQWNIELIGATKGLSFKHQQTGGGWTEHMSLDTAGIHMPDSHYLYLGTGDDLRLYHNGTDSYIDTNVGDLRLYAQLNQYLYVNNTELALQATANGAVHTYYNGNRRTSTTTNGLNVLHTSEPILELVNSSTTIINGSTVGSIKWYSDDGVGEVAKIQVNALETFDSASNRSEIAFHLGTDLGTLQEEMILQEQIDETADLFVSGDVVAFSSTPSDARLKYNVQELISPLQKVNDLRAVTFGYKYYDEMYPSKARTRYGFIADELEVILPELVHKKQWRFGTYQGDDTLYKQIYTDELIPLLVGAVQEQSKIIEDQKTTISQLRKDMNKLLMGEI